VISENNQLWQREEESSKKKRVKQRGMLAWKKTMGTEPRGKKFQSRPSLKDERRKTTLTSKDHESDS